VIISAFNKALQEALEVIKQVSIPIDTSSDEEMLSLIKTSIGTKFVIRWADLMCKLALQAIRTVTVAGDASAASSGTSASPLSNLTVVDIKRYARIEKVPGGAIEDSKVLDGVMLNKDITHPQMRRKIVNPKIILLDCPLEYKKGESQTNIEISKENQWMDFQDEEEKQVRDMCERIMEFKPDLVFTEKGVSGMCYPSLA
jgi:T-complex protein 1 subunit gamma